MVQIQAESRSSLGNIFKLDTLQVRKSRKKDRILDT